MSAHEAFSMKIKFSVGSGDKILFWLDTKVGERPLAVEFPSLFLCASDQQAKVSNYMSRYGDQTQWGPILRRNLTEEGENELRSFLLILSQVFIPKVGENSRVWSNSQDGVFSSSSFFYAIVKSLPSLSPLSLI